MNNVEEKEVLINRSQMLEIAREYKIFVSKSTIHRWANEPDFPLPVGQGGRNILYSKGVFVKYLKKRIGRIRGAH